MQSQFNAAINQLVSEKNLPRDIVEDIIKSAFKAAYKKDFGTREQNIDVELSESGEMATVFQILTVVESVEDPDLEISPEEALKYVKKAKIIHNRKLAINKGINITKKNEVLLVAGKGHENYQIFKNKKIYFSDLKEIKNNLRI